MKEKIWVRLWLNAVSILGAKRPSSLCTEGIAGVGLLVSLHVIVTTASECLGFYPNDEIKGAMLHFLFWKTVSGLKKKKKTN